MKDYKMKGWSFLVILLLTTTLSMAQSKISGQVLDAESGEPLPGVTVYSGGAGTVTDIDGNYSVEVESGASISYSFIGYLTQTIKVEGRSQIDVKLEEDVVALEEVVVTGYGVQKKKVVTIHAYL